MYRYLDEIKGDGEFIVNAETLSELLEEAGLAMVRIMYNTEKVGNDKDVKIEVTGSDPEELLYNWLSEIMVIQDSENIFFKDFKVNVNKTDIGYTAIGKGIGSGGNPEIVQAYVKAITLHNYYVKKTNDGWEARVVVDL